MREVRRSGRPGQRFESLAALEQALALDASEEFRRLMRDEAIACLVLPDVQFVAATNLPRLNVDWMSALFDESLELGALSNQSNAVRVLRVADGGAVATLVTAPWRPQHLLRFSPDARFLDRKSVV